VTLDAAARERILRARAGDYARVAMANIRREYPTHVAYLVTGPGTLPSPRELHPAFYGSFDWHSCVEMHWVLVRLLRLVPDLPSATEIRAALDENLTPGALLAEAAYVSDADHRGFERPYGWGWALALVSELAGLGDRDAMRWYGNMRPLADALRDRFREWLPKATYPVRTGMHGNSAFGLLLALAFARRESPELESDITAAALRWFGDDIDYPAAWEPSGSDFLSPALTEATLMSEVLPRQRFPAWLDRFLPALAGGDLASLLRPAIVSDPTDGQIAHLHGLNLSRAWCMRRVAEALPAGDPRAGVLLAAMERHAEASIDAVVGSDYMVEHWLAAYAVLLLG
jgi:hypothetical protein